MWQHLIFFLILEVQHSDIEEQLLIWVLEVFSTMVLFGRMSVNFILCNILNRSKPCLKRLSVHYMSVYLSTMSVNLVCFSVSASPVGVTAYIIIDGLAKLCRLFCNVQSIHSRHVIKNKLFPKFTWL